MDGPKVVVSTMSITTSKYTPASSESASMGCLRLLLGAALLWLGEGVHSAPTAGGKIKCILKKDNLCLEAFGENQVSPRRGTVGNQV